MTRFEPGTIVAWRQPNIGVVVKHDDQSLEIQFYGQKGTWIFEPDELDEWAIFFDTSEITA